MKTTAAKVALNGLTAGIATTTIWTEKKGVGKLFVVPDTNAIREVKVWEPHRCPRCRIGYAIDVTEIDKTGAPFHEICPPCKDAIRCDNPQHPADCWCGFHPY